MAPFGCALFYAVERTLAGKPHTVADSLRTKFAPTMLVRISGWLKPKSRPVSAVLYLLRWRHKGVLRVRVSSQNASESDGRFSSPLQRSRRCLLFQNNRASAINGGVVSIWWLLVAVPASSSHSRCFCFTGFLSPPPQTVPMDAQMRGIFYDCRSFPSAAGIVPAVAGGAHRELCAGAARLPRAVHQPRLGAFLGPPGSCRTGPAASL